MPKDRINISFFEISSREELTFLPASYIALRSFFDQTSPFSSRFNWTFLISGPENDLDDLLESIDPLSVDVFCGACYCWSMKQVLAIARALKAKNPEMVVILGGPEIPASREKFDAFSKGVKFVDFVVHGEGEERFKSVLESLVTGAEPVSDGVSRRKGKEFVFSPPSEKRVELGSIKDSPYRLSFVEDLFLDFKSRNDQVRVVLETNRGCPYSCTFCNWGSLTESKVYQFDLLRILEDIDSVFSLGVTGIYIADANFGILKRDGDIVSKIERLQRATGKLRQISMNSAKNINGSVIEICKRLSDLNLDVPFGITMSFQALTKAVVDNIKRDNIDLHRLKAEMESRGVSLGHSYSEFIVGLPGEDLCSWFDTLQFIHEHRLQNIVFYPFQLLENSPAANPAYVATHGLRSRSSRYPRSFVLDGRRHFEEWSLVLETNTMTADDFRKVFLINEFFLCVNAVPDVRDFLSQRARELGVRYVDLLDRLLERLRARETHISAVIEFVARAQEESLFSSERPYAREIAQQGDITHFAGFLKDQLLSSKYLVLKEVARL